MTRINILYSPPSMPNLLKNKMVVALMPAAAGIGKPVK